MTDCTWRAQGLCLSAVAAFTTGKNDPEGPRRVKVSGHDTPLFSVPSFLQVQPLYGSMIVFVDAHLKSATLNIQYIDKMVMYSNYTIVLQMWYICI